MRTVALLIILLVCMVVQAQNAGPSEYLRFKWAVWYAALTKHGPPQCSSQRLIAIDWQGTLFGQPPESLPKEEFLAILSQAYIEDKHKFEQDILSMQRSGTQFLDYDRSGFISNEEYIVGFLCIGLDLSNTMILLHAFSPTSDGIPVDLHTEAWVEFLTEPQKANENYSLVESLKQLTK